MSEMYDLIVSGNSKVSIRLNELIMMLLCEIGNRKRKLRYCDDKLTVMFEYGYIIELIYKFNKYHSHERGKQVRYMYRNFQNQHIILYCKLELRIITKSSHCNPIINCVLIFSVEYHDFEDHSRFQR